MFEGIVVDKSKDAIIAACSKFQIGGIPNHRPQEHLFCVKSVIQLYSLLDKPLFIQIYDVAKYFDKEILKDAMDTLYKSGIKGKLYRLWYELYRDAQIRVKTAAGLTSLKTTGENVSQGSIGGALLSSANLDKTITSYFSGSDSEVSYGSSRLSVLMFQDDALRLADSLLAVQKGNMIIEAAMKRKQLSLSIEKCSILVFDKKSQHGCVREAVNRDKSLKICNQILKAKVKDDYLGDVLHEEGLTKSVHATIDKRYGKSYMAIVEVMAILNDFRIDTVGGILAGLQIFDLAIIPGLLNNAETWTQISKESEKKLENLQNTMFRYLFGVPESTPTPVLRFELGSLTIREKIHVKKLTFIHHLKYLDTGSLASEFYNLQVKYHFPGLVNECRTLLKGYNLPDIIDSNLDFTKETWKNMVKKAIKSKSEENAKKEMVKYSKVGYLGSSDEKLSIKDYVRNMSLRNARMMFRIRSSMTDVKMNKKSDKKYASELWKCDLCGHLDSQSHVLWCPAFSSLREGRSLDNDSDLVTYFHQVMKIKNEKLN